MLRKVYSTAALRSVINQCKIIDLLFHLNRRCACTTLERQPRGDLLSHRNKRFAAVISYYNRESVDVWTLANVRAMPRQHCTKSL